MSTVEDRAADIYAFLKAHQGKKYKLGDLCQRLGLQPGAKTRAAIRHARDLATADGLHFPPAVPQNGHTYSVIAMPEDALDPALHMSRVEAGVRHRADVGYEHMEREQKQLPKDLRPWLKGFIAVQKEIRRSQASLQRIYEEQVIEMVKSRREGR